MANIGGAIARRSAAVVIAIAVTLLVTLTMRLDPALLNRVEGENYDLRFRIRGVEKPGPETVIVAADEKTAIQALDRLDPVLPLSPGRIERHGFEYFRHGTLSLYAALDTATGRVHGKTARRHTSRDFVVFLKEDVALCPSDQQIHIILDNLSAHKTALVREFLEQHPRVRFHFTPTYSSWLNQVELWFAKIEREVIARGVFTSVPDLARKLRRYINAYSANAQPINWKYSDPSHRIRSNELSATGH